MLCDSLGVLICGFYGYVSKNTSDDSQIILNMSDGFIEKEYNNIHIYRYNNISLGCLTSNIISETNNEQSQKININGKNYIIVYNGELYNALDLKNTLVMLGYSFSTNNDTEIILNAYIEHKEKCLNLFDGIYSFAIYSKEDDLLFFARDRLGIKPLFYTFSKDGDFVFASKINALLKHPKIQPSITKDEVCELFGFRSCSHTRKNFL